MSRLDMLVDVDVKGDSKLSGLGSGLRNIATLAVGAGAAVAGIAAFTSGFASDLNESLSKVNVVFGRNAKEIENWSETAAAAMGISQQQALESAGTFGNLFSAMDIGQDASVDMSTNLVQLASDLASFNNIDPTEALTALRAGIVGEAEPLRRLGVNISAARTEAKALELGLWDGIGPIDAAAKAQANYALIIEDSTLAQGDFARTADGMANQQRTLGAVFSDTMASIGQAFLPLIEAMLPQITAGMQSFGAWVTVTMPTIQEVIGNVLGAIGAGFTFLIDEILPRAIEIISWIATNIFPMFGQAAGTVGNDIIPAITSAIQFLVDEILPGLVSAFQAVVGWVTANMPTISSVFGQVFGAITNVVRAVWPILEAIATVLFPILSVAATVLLNALDIAFKAIGGIFEVLGTVTETVWKAIESVWKGAGDFFEGVWDAIVGAVKGGVNAFIGIINGIIGGINAFQIHLSLDIPFGPHVQFDWNGLNLPTIPFLAEGGIISGPTLAMLGERGPEAVIPLDQLQTGATVNVTVQGDLKADERTLPGQILRTLYVAGMAD
jgi:hypothetical protein